MRLPPAGRPFRYLNVPVAWATSWPSASTTEASQNASDDGAVQRRPVPTQRGRGPGA